MGDIVCMEDPEALDETRVGRKFAALARASRLGFAVPEAVAVGTRAHAAWRSSGAWPEGLKQEVLAAAGRLGWDAGLAVRSSAVKEDLAGHSFAGQYRSFLHVSSPEELFRCVENCWESAASETVRAYLTALAVEGSKAEAPLLAVVLQRMVPAAWSGVAFSRDPRAPQRTEALWIEAVAGTAETLVSGLGIPWRVRIARRPGARPEPDAGSARRMPPALPWKAVAGLLLNLEKRLGENGLDMEWAVDRDGILWLLQLRPITAAAAVPEDLPPPGIWTRRLAEDLWGDRIEPFFADVLLRHAPRFDLSRILNRLGIPPARPSLAVIAGYLYLNAGALGRMTAQLPRRWRPAELERLLPPRARPEAVSAPSLPRQAELLLRLLVLPFREPECLPGVCLRRAACTLTALGERIAESRRLPGETAAERLAALAFDLETLARIQEHNQWPYFHAAALLTALREAAARRGLPGEDVLRLIGREADNVTIRIEAWFRKTAARIRSRPELADRFAAAPTGSDLRRILPPDLERELERFLAAWGARARHRSLLVPRWEEAPEEVLKILHVLVRNSSPGGLAGGGDVLAPPLLLRWLARWVTRFLDLREELRFLLDRALYRIRIDLLALGRLLGTGEEIFFLRLEEIEALVQGALALPEALHRAGRRKRRFATAPDPSPFWIDGRPHHELTTAHRILRGIGASPGTATGRAVLVNDPADPSVRRGDILVARHTDPGWTPVFSIAGGVVTEEGGLLNHCAIVARELGIPTVVGVRGAMRLVPQGARITVDGSSGTILIPPG